MASLFPDLPVLGAAMVRAQPKGPTKLDIKVLKVKTTMSRWNDCRAIVDKRDGGKCRVCKKPVVKTIALDPKRAEHHHLCKRRKEKALLTDARNVILVHLSCHQKLEKHDLIPVGAHFELNHAFFIDADAPLTFRKATK